MTGQKKSCFHCGYEFASDALVYDAICIHCASDSTTGRVDFTTERIIGPFEKCKPTDFYREEMRRPIESIPARLMACCPESGRALGNEDGTEVFNAVGLSIRPIRFADAEKTKRFLDAGERFDYTSASIGVEENIKVVGWVDAPIPVDVTEAAAKEQRFRVRCLLDIEQIAKKGCECPEGRRVKLPNMDAIDDTAKICLDCGKIWSIRDWAGRRDRETIRQALAANIIERWGGRGTGRGVPLLSSMIEQVIGRIKKLPLEKLRPAQLTAIENILADSKTIDDVVVIYDLVCELYNTIRVALFEVVPQEEVPPELIAMPGPDGELAALMDHALANEIFLQREKNAGPVPEWMRMIETMDLYVRDVRPMNEAKNGRDGETLVEISWATDNKDHHVGDFPERDEKWAHGRVHLLISDSDTRRAVSSVKLRLNSTFRLQFKKGAPGLAQIVHENFAANADQPGEINARGREFDGKGFTPSHKELEAAYAFRRRAQTFASSGMTLNRVKPDAEMKIGDIILSRDSTTVQIFTGSTTTVVPNSETVMVFRPVGANFELTGTLPGTPSEVSNHTVGTSSEAVSYK
jgi:hypothetical protein